MYAFHLSGTSSRGQIASTGQASTHLRRGPRRRAAELALAAEELLLDELERELAAAR
jgi:hypothetical protein